MHLPIQNNSNDDKTSIEIQSNRDISPVNIHNLPETKIVHLGQRSKDECGLFIQTGKRAHKALWDSGACKCVLSLESYHHLTFNTCHLPIWYIQFVHLCSSCIQMSK